MPESSPLQRGALRNVLARALPSVLSSLGLAPAPDSTPAPLAPPDATQPTRSTSERLAGYLRQEPEFLSPRTLRKLLQEMQAIVDPRISEAEGSRRAQPLIDWYHDADHDARADAWRLMAEQFAPDPDTIRQAKDQYDAALGTRDEARAEIRLRKAFNSPRTRLLQRLGGARQGMRFLLDVRSELLQQLKCEPALLPLDAELEALFNAWFDIAFLELRRISWNSPASLIEQLIKYEAVHDIVSWDDAKNRLDDDRRCFGFFHPRLPNEPLIFVEVALTRALSDSMEPLLDVAARDADLERANTAIFYSISNTQTGLRGVGFGDSLIKRVVEALQQELPQIRQFATLSPIPGFRKWLQQHAAEVSHNVRLKLAQQLPPAVSLQAPDWPQAIDSTRTRNASAPEQRLLRGAAAMYLSSLDARGRPLDPVARFHLSNGARLEHIHWHADPSAKGQRQSFGLMVNYLYDLNRLDRHRAMLAAGKVAVSRQVAALRQFD